MQHLEVSGAVRHIYIYAIRWLKVKLRSVVVCDFMPCGSVRGVNVSEEYGASTFRLEEVGSRFL